MVSWSLCYKHFLSLPYENRLIVFLNVPRYFHGSQVTEWGRHKRIEIINIFIILHTLLANQLIIVTPKVPIFIRISFFTLSLLQILICSRFIIINWSYSAGCANVTSTINTFMKFCCCCMWCCCIISYAFKSSLLWLLSLCNFFIIFI